MKDYEYFLFDFDGTLIDTFELIYQSYAHIIRKFLNREVSREQIFRDIGFPIRAQMQLYFGPMNDQKLMELAAEYDNYQYAHSEEYLALFPGVKEGLLSLKEHGKLLALVTSRRRESVERYIAQFGIQNCFSATVTPETTDKHKPEPEPALQAMEMLAAKDFSKALFIGDTYFDMECGRRAGMDTAFVLWSATRPEDLEVKPTHLLKEFKELQSL